MTENLAGWGEGLAGHSERVMRIALKAIINMAHRAWEDKASVETMFRLIGKRAKGALGAAPTLEANVDDPSEEDFKLATDFLWGTDGKPTTENVLTFIQTVREAAAPAGTAPDKVMSDAEWASLSAESRHNINLALQYGRMAANLNERLLATPSPQAPQEQGNAFSTTSAREQSSATASDNLSASDANEQWLELARILRFEKGDEDGDWFIPAEPQPLGPFFSILQAAIAFMRFIDATDKTMREEIERLRAATQEPAGSGASRSVQRRIALQKGYSMPEYLYEAQRIEPGSPRKVGEDGPVTRETLEHWLRVVKSTLNPDGWDCGAPELRRMREQLEALLARSSSVPVGEQKQEEGV